MVLRRRRKCRRHFGSSTDQRYDHKSDERRSHSKRNGGLLDRTDEDFAHQRNQNRDCAESNQRNIDWPNFFMSFRFAGEQFAVRLERKEKPETVSDQKQDR